MKLYHGSFETVKKPSLEKGKLNNDFGQGFYCTQELDKAKQWACRNIDIGVVNEYELNINKLKVLDLCSKEFHVLNWIAILMKNRKFNDSNQLSNSIKEYMIKNFLVDLCKYDVVVGYRADDSYFSFARSFVSNSLTVKDLEKSLKLGNLGKQVVLISNKAFKNIKFKKLYKINDSKHHKEFISNEKNARQEFQKLSLEITEGTYAIDIVRMKIKNKDERLRDILSK